MRLSRLGVILITVFAMQGVTVHARLADAAYAEKIKAYTTDERFLCDVVDHLPTSESVRTGWVVSL